MDNSEQHESKILEQTSLFFGEETPLRRAQEVGGRPYEPRPQQREMAELVAKHLHEGHHLCVEAPTGVGKTFAYLVPAIHFALERDLPVVITTHTISLQEQILEKDLPVLARLMNLEFKAAIAKGRGNYLCLRRLNAAADQNQEFLPGPDMVGELDRLYRWSEETTDGSLSNLDFEPMPAIWDAVCCEMGNCLNGKCPFFRRCFLMKARQRLVDAQIIIANHAIFFSDLAMKHEADSEEGGILPAYAAVILDEGHTIEDSAATHLGLRLSAFGLHKILNRLYHPDRNRGLLVDSMYTEARLAVIAASEKAKLFFAKLHDWLERQEQNPLRYTVPGHVPDFLAPCLELVECEVRKLVDTEEGDERRTELKSLNQRLNDYRLGLHAFLDMTLPEHVYWFERQGQSLRQISLNAVPIEVAPLLRRHLFEQNFTVIITSATLAIRGRMEYFQLRLGAESADPHILTSPFDFEKQVTLHIPFDMPSPKDTHKFVPAACEHIRKFLLETGGKAFVLFTSYRMMHDAAVELTDFFDETGLQLFIQGEGLPRSRMLEAFRKDVNSVIFGTASFWTGVDVPGEALSNVIIVKLPFAVPDHPLVAARQEMIEKNGGRAFWEYSLPEAILKFRQGFGRLIRSRDDHGIVVVLDNRIVRTSYGKAFLESIPPCTRNVF